MTLLTAIVSHVNNPPVSVLVCLVVAIALAVVAAVVAGLARAFWGMLIAAALVFSFLAQAFLFT